LSDFANPFDLREYVPMLHGTKDQTLTEFTKAKDSFASRGVKAVMSFNEPNKGDDAATGGSNVSPTDAAAKHQEYLNDLPYDIVAPAVSQGGDDWWRVSRHTILRVKRLLKSVF
jgi:hypothetical protein